MKTKRDKTYLETMQEIYKLRGRSGIRFIRKMPPRVQKCPSEAQEQIRVADWLRVMKIPHHHSPNGGLRNPREGAKFKRLGTNPGFPDIFIPQARKGYHGLCIELKRLEGGKLTETQVVWKDILLAEGYSWHEAKGADECIKIIEEYLQ